MIEAYKKMYVNYFNFQGKTSRGDFWKAFLVNFIFINILNVIVKSTGIEAMKYINYVYILFIFIPVLSMKVRRLKDAGKSGWLVLWELIPLLGTIIVYILCAMPSDDTK